jgi:hypothetical protein
LSIVVLESEVAKKIEAERYEIERLKLEIVEEEAMRAEFSDSETSSAESSSTDDEDDDDELRDMLDQLVIENRRLEVCHQICLCKSRFCEVRNCDNVKALKSL